ncbi:MAG: POTRA domain-containing protein, partial [Bacteroidota bacterium]
DDNAIISIAGLRVGNNIRIPGGDIPKAIKALWKLRLFTDVQVYKTKTIGDVIFLEIAVQERPRLVGHSFRNTKKTYHDDLNDAVNKYLLKGGIVTEDVKVNAAEEIKEYFIEKGYLDADVNVLEVEDTIRTNAVRLVFDIDRKERIKIKDITFEGNTIKARKLRGLLKNTRRKRRLFASSKLIQSDYKEDKKALINYYNTIGFRDAQIIEDSIWRDEKGDLMLNFEIDEGNRYYFRDLVFKGNSIYDDEALYKVLGIEKGDVYNQDLLNTRLSFSQDGRDVSSLYLDNGYLFFQVDPIEVAVDNDSIDLEIRLYEGPQATIDKVTIKGNDRTHEHVIRRELRTLPGQKFSRSDIIRSQRQVINLNYFNPESLGINTPVNPQRGTVDIEYSVEEKPSDQLELSAGWGGNRGLIGTLGVSFNNFSIRNIAKRETWNPLPQGDGQRLSLRAQTNGQFFQSYNASFTEPWLGGRKPNSFTVAGFANFFNSRGGSFSIV